MNTEDIVEKALRSLGFTVRRIEEGSTKKPDFLVRGDSRYLVEVKDKLPDPDKLERRQEILLAGQAYGEHEPTGYRNAVSSVIREAAGQLAAYRDEPVDFRIVWLHALGQHVEVQRSQMQATLYGSAEIIDLDELGGTVVSRPCLYFDFSEFFSQRDVLDGAVIATDTEALFCFNALSPRYLGLRESALCRAFHPGIYDPMEEERAGRAYTADFDMSRKDEAAVLKRLQDKYGRLHLLNSEPVRHSVQISAPLPPNRLVD